MGFFMRVCFLLLVVDTSIAQTCDKPKPIKHAVLKPAHRNSEEFKDGATIGYGCDIGYNIEGNSRDRTCEGGIWSEIDFSCTLRTCPYVPPIENGRRLDWNNGAGDSTQFACNIGYKLIGRAEILCLTNGQWSPSNPPICEPIRCPELLAIQHGRISQVSGEMRNIYGNKAVYKCNSGYRVLSNMVNQVTRQCQAGGSWSGEEPVCDVPRCEKIQPFYGGKVTFIGGRRRWTMAFYLCQDNYSLFPANVDNSECSDDLEWTPRPPQCKKKSMAKIPKYGYKSLGNNILLHKDTYTLRCKNNYELYNGTFLEKSSLDIRNLNGTLTPEVPTCTEERCNPADLSNAKVTYKNDTIAMTKVRSRTTVYVSCKDRFEFYSTKNQSVKIQCVKGGFKNPPTCREKRCRFSRYPDNYDTVHKLSGSDYSLLAPDARIRHRQQIAVSCRNDDYELYVDSTNTYLAKFTTTCRYGQFDVRRDSFPVCLGKRCLFTLSPNTCFWINDDDSQKCKIGDFKVRSGKSVNLKCKPGYNLYRSEGGTSKKITHNTAIECNKGSYFAGYKCIPEHFTQKVTDFVSTYFNKLGLGDVMDKLTCRYNILDYLPIGGCKDPCIIPEVQNGFAKLEHFDDKVTDIVPHNNKITIQCNIGYKRSTYITSACMFGEWDNENWPQCTPNPCQLTFHPGEIFWKASKLLTRNEGTKLVLASGTTIHIKCQDGYLLMDTTSGTPKQINNEKKYSTCNVGLWTHNYTCDEATCTVPVVYHATLQSKAVPTYSNTEKATFICDDGFHFQQNLSSKVIQHESTCRLGIWTTRIPGQCKPDSCNMILNVGSKYVSAVTNDEITTAGLKDHNTKVILECLENFDLFDNKGNIIQDKDFVDYVVCDHGTWRNIYHCNQQCVTFNVKHGRLMRGNESVPSSEKITHGNQLSVECYSDTNLSNTITCNNGKWKNRPACAVSTDNNDAQDMDATDITISGCKLSEDARFMYTDEHYNDVASGTVILPGTVLSVSCISIDMLHNNDYSEDVVVNVTCTDQGLLPEIECAESVPNTKCMELEHGHVKKQSSYYVVSCDSGYSLNLLQPDKPQCNCVDGLLKCTYGGQKPTCSPDDCVLPYDIDARLLINNQLQESLSGGYTVKVGDYVIFNCSNVDEQKYEPLNRRFKCDNGKWLEDEKDKEWTFGNNGTFPKCREAICKPECENLGVCHRDDKCKCNHLTTGERCETVVCDQECISNGGQCIKPGVCGKCPVGQQGNNCEVFSCKIPDSAAAVRSPRLFYASGETIPCSEFGCPDKYMLSSSNGMECLEDGMWSHIITCVKEVTYLIRVQTAVGNWYSGVGTSANIYIYLNGEDGSTNKINLSGPFESGKLAVTTKSEKDIRPIQSVRIGHDGTGFFDDWELEFVSVYIEDVDEFYVFRHHGDHWVFKDKDVTLPRRNAFNEVCINTFGDKQTWYPKDWRYVNDTSLGARISERECKQRCTEQIKQRCIAVIYDSIYKNCFGFSKVDQIDFNVMSKSESTGFFFKKCNRV